MGLWRCKNCKHFEPWSDREKLPEGVKAGDCGLEPFDCRSMKPDQMTTFFGHDGPVVVGAEFGCIHFESKDKAEYVGGEITPNDDGTINIAAVEIQGNAVDINADGMREILENIGISIIEKTEK